MGMPLLAIVHIEQPSNASYHGLSLWFTSLKSVARRTRTRRRSRHRIYNPRQVQKMLTLKGSNWPRLIQNAIASKMRCYNDCYIFFCTLRMCWGTLKLRSTPEKPKSCPVRHVKINCSEANCYAWYHSIYSPGGLQQRLLFNPLKAHTLIRPFSWGTTVLSLDINFEKFWLKTRKPDFSYFFQTDSCANMCKIQVGKRDLAENGWKYCWQEPKMWGLKFEYIWLAERELLKGISWYTTIDSIRN